MSFIRHSVFFGIAVILVAAAPADTRPAPTETIRAANKRIQEKLAQKKPHAEVTREVRDLLDVSYLAQRALESHWEKMTAQQRADMEAVFSSIIEKSYLSQISGELDYTIEYTGEEKKAEDDVLVKTVIVLKKNDRPQKIYVDYRLRPVGNQWKVFDMITEDVSMIQNYRGQFGRIIAKEGIDGLIAKMKAKVEQGDKP